MSECVVRMEMPICCHDCPFEADQWDYPICRVTGRSEGYRFDARNNRMVDCPIVCQLPKGHGRLVDADALKDYFIAEAASYDLTQGQMGIFSEAIDMIDEQPTIVPPAERSET